MNLIVFWSLIKSVLLVIILLQFLFILMRMFEGC